MRKLILTISSLLPLLTATAEVTYKYDETTKTLTFSGEGEMDVYKTDDFGDTYVSPAWKDLKSDVEKVVINKGVTNVGKHAFMSFEKLKDVTLPSTIEIIDVAAFEECKALTEITLPESLKEMGLEAFYGCSSLTSIKLPQKMTSLPDYAFSGCKSLKSVDLGNVRTFGKSAFRYCGFESFVIPEGTKTISETMFMSCTSLKTIEIPGCIEVIENEAFHYCKLDTIYFVGDVMPEIKGGNNFNTNVISVNCNAYSSDVVEELEGHGAAYDTEIIPSWPRGTKISSSSSWSPLTIIPVDCDNNLYKLSVELESGYKLTWEGDYDLPEGDVNKPEITVNLSKPYTLTAKVEYEGGGGLIIIPMGINLTTDVIGKGTVEKTTLDSTSESATFKLKAIPSEGYKFSRWEPFGYGVTLTDEEKTKAEIEVTITVASSLDAYFVKEDNSDPDTPGDGEGQYCGKDGGTNISWYVKNDTLYLEGEGEMEDYEVLEDQAYITTEEDFSVVILGEGITNVGNNAFSFLVDIEEIYLPSTLTNIGLLAFAECDDLKHLHFAGAKAPTFRNLKDLFYGISESIEIDVPCASIDEYKKVLAKYTETDDDDEEVAVALNVTCDDTQTPDNPSNPTLDGFTFDPANVCGADEDGSNILWAYDNATGTLALKGSGKMKDYDIRKKAPWSNVTVNKLIVSEGITTIGDYALYQQDSLKEISLPITVELIGSYAFSETYSLKEIILPEGLVTISQNAFKKAGLTSVTLPSTLKSIGGYSFQYCEFPTITIPESVEGIGRGAFDYSKELETIVFKGTTPPSTGGYTFISNSTGDLKKLIVPCEAEETYKAEPGYNTSMIQGEYPYTLKVSQKTNDTETDLGGRGWTIQWPDCETGEAIIYAKAREAYQFSHWEATGITLTEEQAKADTISFTVDADCRLTAIFKDKVISNVDVVKANDVVVTVSDGRISVNRNEFNVYDILGRDVTSANGALKPGVYVVKCEGKTRKAVLK